MNISAKADAIDLKEVSRGLGLEKEILGKAQGILNLSGSLEDPVISASARASNIHLGKDLPGVSASAKFKYSEGKASLEGSLKPDTGGDLAVNAKMPMNLRIPLPGQWLPESGLDAKISGKSLSLAFAPQWIKGIKETDAVLDIDGRIAGNLKAPSIDGTATLKASKIIVDKWDYPITDLAAHVKWDPKKLEITSLSAKTQEKGSLSASGTIALADLQPGEMDIGIKADNLNISRGKIFHASTSGDVNLKGAWPKLFLSGMVEIGEGEFLLDPFLAEKRRQVAVEKDVKIVGETEQEKQDVKGVEITDLIIKIVGPFWIRGEGPQIEVKGRLEAKRPPGASATSYKGYISAERGMYTFYGKAFQIEKGRADFLGLTPPDPNLDVLCSRKVPGAIIYLAVGGSPSAMTLTLSSDLGLDQADIASLLMFGKQTSELSNGEAKTLEERGAAILGAKVIDELKEFIGAEVPLDILSVESNGGGSDQDLVLGKYLSPKLFITYRRQMSSDGANKVQLEYQLTPQISVESQVGESESGVDLFWSYEY